MNPNDFKTNEQNNNYTSVAAYQQQASYVHSLARFRQGNILVGFGKYCSLGLNTYVTYSM